MFFKRTKKRKKGIIYKIKKSPINFFSDLFIIAFTTMWIFNNIYQMIVASIVTFSSIVLSYKTNTNMYELSMWSNIGENIAIPLTTGAGIWMVKNSIQHAIMNHKGKECKADFPSVDDTEETNISEEDI